MGAVRPFFYFLQGEVTIMNGKTRRIAHGAMIGAMYVVLCHLQNMLFPESATFAIQFRAAEALCVFAYFTQAAVPGLTAGCFLFNLTFAGALPMDLLIGTAATFLTAVSMRKLKHKPFLGFLMPAFWNAILVGLELTVYIGGGFWFNALCVAVGEAAVLLTLGAALYTILKKRPLRQIFE
jgi:uncharacterized membrane protein